MGSLRWSVALFFTVGLARASAAPPDAPLQDVLHTMQARKALLEDDTLARLNIGVKVAGRVAVLWGPVPSADAALRAEAKLRGLIELIDVRNELIITSDDPREPALQPRIAPEPAPPALPRVPERHFLL
jgi:hypothetical protein